MSATRCMSSSTAVTQPLLDEEEVDFLSTWSASGEEEEEEEDGAAAGVAASPSRVLWIGGRLQCLLDNEIL